MDARRCGDDGLALIVVMMAMVLLSALGAALILVTSSETLIAATYRSSVEAFYAADAIGERAIDELSSIADWNAVLNGLVRSSFVDGPADGARALADGATLDLGQAVNMANCGNTICSSADIVENTTGDRPWAVDNPVWQLFGYGPLSSMLSGESADTPFYVMAMVAKHPPAHAGDPLVPIMVRAEAFGPRSTHTVIELTVARIFTGPDGQDGQDGQEGQSA